MLGAVVATCAAYALLFNSSFVPQLVGKPPARVELGVETPADDLVEAGATIFEAECAQCHKIGAAGRGPDLAGIGPRAAERAASAGGEATALDYLVSSLCRPDAFLVDGFGNIMPPQNKRLDGGQILATVAFLESLGGEPSVDGTQVELIEQHCGGGGDAGGDGVAAAAAPEPVGTPEEVVVRFGCVGCHDMAGTNRMLGPGLGDVGARLDAGALYEALLDPDATLPEADPPYPATLMKATLGGNGFYDAMRPADMVALVAWLGARTGAPLEEAP